MNKLNYLCTFTDDSQTKIASLKTFLPGQEISEQDYIVLPEDDERVQACLNPSEEKYVQRIKINTLEDLYRLADLYDRASPKPLYRGQSDYSWKLETPLERNRSEFVKKDMGLEIYEHHTLDESKRRFHEFFT